jgi:hypothetical protein
MRLKQSHEIVQCSPTHRPQECGSSPGAAHEENTEVALRNVFAASLEHRQALGGSRSPRHQTPFAYPFDRSSYLLSVTPKAANGSQTPAKNLKRSSEHSGNTLGAIHRLTRRRRAISFAPLGCEEDRCEKVDL